MSDKATRAQIRIGSHIVGEPEINARQFLTSKGIQSLLGESYTSDAIAAAGYHQCPSLTQV